MINRSLFLAGALALATAGGAALTAGAASAQDDAAPAAATGPQARAFASVQRGGSSFLFKRGFKALTKQAPGVFCLKLGKELLVDRQFITPSVTVEYSNSAGSNLAAYFDGFSCDDGQIGVRTFKFTSSGGNEPSDDVAFVVFIP